MRWHRSLSAVGALALSGGSALAEQATPEGADAIGRGYAAYFGSAVLDKGIVTVTPQGESYLVSWSLQKALEAADAPSGAFHVGDFSYVLTPGPGDTWTLNARHFPQIAFDVPTDKGRASGAVAFDGFQLDNSYDPQAAEFLRSTLALDNLTGSFHVVDGPQDSDFAISEDGLTAETRAKPSSDGAGVDVALAQASKSMKETITAPPADGEAPVQMTYTFGAAVGGAALQGLRAREIGEFWKYVVAHSGQASPPPGDVKPLFQSMLPLWTEIRADAKVDDMKFEMPMGAAAMKSFGETIDLSGLTASGFAQIGIKLEDFSVTSTLLPGWVASLSPVSFDLNLRVTGEGWDKAARIVLDDPHFGEKGDLSPEVGDEVAEALLAGHPRLVLTPGHLKIPALDLAFEGEASMTEGAPTAHFNVSADSLDKAIALLQDIAKVEPQAQSALLGVTLFKGLATTAADGRLVWVIDTNPGGVTVNGSPLPMDR